VSPGDSFTCSSGVVGGASDCPGASSQQTSDDDNQAGSGGTVVAASVGAAAAILLLLLLVCCAVRRRRSSTSTPRTGTTPHEMPTVGRTTGSAVHAQAPPHGLQAAPTSYAAVPARYGQQQPQHGEAVGWQQQPAPYVLAGAYPNSALAEAAGGTYQPAPSKAGHKPQQDMVGTYSYMDGGVAPPYAAGNSYDTRSTSPYNAGAFDVTGYGSVPRAP